MVGAVEGMIDGVTDGMMVDTAVVVMDGIVDGTTVDFADGSNLVEDDGSIEL